MGCRLTASPAQETGWEPRKIPFPGSWQAQSRSSKELLQRWEVADSVSPSLMCQGNGWRGQMGTHRPQTVLRTAGPEAGQRQRWPESNGQSPVWSWCHQCVGCHQHLCWVVLPEGGTGDLEGLGGSGGTPWQCLPAPSWILEEQHVKEHPGQCRSGHAWQQMWSGRDPEEKVCSPRATWHYQSATHPTVLGHPISCQALLTCLPPPTPQSGQGDGR